MAQPRSTRFAIGILVAVVAAAFAGPAGAQTDPTTTTTSTTAVPTGPPEKTVKVLDNIFEPKKVKVPVGTKVIWKWGGVAAHNVVVTKGPQKFKSKTLTKGTFTRTISKPGKYLIVCTLHPGMTMRLRATPAPPPSTTTTGVAEAQPGA